LFISLVSYASAFSVAAISVVEGLFSNGIVKLYFLNLLTFHGSTSVHMQPILLKSIFSLIFVS